MKMSKNDFSYFKIGTIFNPVRLSREPEKIAGNVEIMYPSRLNAMAIDPGKITENNNMIYTPGEVVFSVKIFLRIEIELISGKEDIIIETGAGPKDSIIQHTCLIMRKALNFTDTIKIKITEYHPYKHCGLGSSGALQSAVAAALNYLYGEPISREDLIKYLAQNYGEEIDGDPGHLNPVQCIGGSAASGLTANGMLVVAGKSNVVCGVKIDDSYDVCIGLPSDLELKDSESQFNREKENLSSFLDTSNRFKDKIAYNILHYLMPAMIEGDLKTIGDVIYDYRFNMNSIRNCSFTYPGLLELMQSLAYLKLENHVDVLSLSSVGPAVFCIGKDLDECEGAFNKHALKIIRTKIYNDSFGVIR